MAELINKFSRLYFDNYYMPFKPTIKDRQMAKFLVDTVGENWALLMVDTFYDCLRNAGGYKTCPPTISAMTYNRADLGKRLVEKDAPYESNAGMF